MRKLIEVTFQGIAVSSLILTVITIVVFALKGDQTLSLLTFITYLVAAMVIGVGFSLPSVIYDNPNLSMVIKFIIHMGIGVTILLATIILVGWIPTDKGWPALITGIILAIIFACIIWFIFYLYHRKEARDVNKQIKKIQKQIQ